MRVETDRSRTYHGRKYDDRLKRRNYRNDDYHSRNHSSRSSLNSRHDYSSSRFDRHVNPRDIYSTVSNDQSSANLYYNSSQPIRERGLSSYSDRNRYSNYRREDSTYRNDSYRSPTPLPPAPQPIEQYNDIYRTNDYSNRSERYDIGSNRNYSVASPIYRSDPYHTSSVISTQSSPQPLLSSSSSSSSRDQYVQTVREIDYRTRDYGMTIPMDHRQMNSSDRYHDEYHSTPSYRDRTNLKRSRTDFNENGFKRPMRR